MAVVDPTCRQNINWYRRRRICAEVSHELELSGTEEPRLMGLILADYEESVINAKEAVIMHT